MINVLTRLEVIPEAGTVLEVQNNMSKMFSNQILEKAKVKMDDILNNLACPIHADHDQTVTLYFQGDIMSNSELHYEVTECCCDPFQEQLTAHISEAVQKIRDELGSDQ